MGALETQIANVILAMVKIGPTVITTVEQLVPVAQDIIAKIQSPTPPTQADWDALHSSIEALAADIANAPAPSGTAGA